MEKASLPSYTLVSHDGLSFLFEGNIDLGFVNKLSTLSS